LLTFLKGSADQPSSKHSYRLVDRLLHVHVQLLDDCAAECFRFETLKPYLTYPGRALGPEGSGKEKKGIQSFSPEANVMI